MAFGGGSGLLLVTSAWSGGSVDMGAYRCNGSLYLDGICIVWKIVINTVWDKQQNGYYYKDNNHYDNEGAVCVIIHIYSKAHSAFFVYTLGTMSKQMAFVKDTFLHWQKKRASRMGAAISYYAMFSLAPLFILLTGLVRVIFDKRSTDAAMGHVLNVA